MKQITTINASIEFNLKPEDLEGLTEEKIAEIFAASAEFIKKDIKSMFYDSDVVNVDVDVEIVK